MSHAICLPISSYADTLVPRLEASGADLNHIFFAGEMACGKERCPFDPAKDIPALQAAIEAAGGAGMVIVDPTFPRLRPILTRTLSRSDTPAAIDGVILSV